MPALLGNPFTSDAWVRALRRLDLALARATLRAQLAEGRSTEADATLLAACTARACLFHPRPLSTPGASR